MATIIEVNGERHRKNCTCRICRQARRQVGTHLPQKPQDAVVVSIDGKRQQLSVVPPTPVIGDMERAVIEECAKLSAAQERPAAVTQARKMASILDDMDQSAMWPTTSRQLSAIMDGLRGSSQKKARGRLAQVQKMTPRGGRRTG
jgi:hypothetical protein